MNEIQDIKKVFDTSEWEKRVAEDPRRIYAFLLCNDEHEALTTYIQKAWRTLDALSGKACDVFTFERWEDPQERFNLRGYVRIEGGTLGSARKVSGDAYGFPGQEVAIDNGLMLPDRTQCLAVKDKLFQQPGNIILPGLAVFPSAYTRESAYYNCSGLDATALSDMFQRIFASIQEAYAKGDERFDVFDEFQRTERLKIIKSRLTKALLQITLKDIFDILTGSIGLVTPKGKNEAT